MRKVHWMQTGGVPIRNDDWHYEQEGLREAMRWWHRGTVGESYRLWGVDVTLVGSNLVHTEGAVVLDGEVYYVPAGSTPMVHNFRYYEVVVQDEPSGDVALENGGVGHIHKNRVAVVASYATAQPLTAERFDMAAVNGRTFAGRVREVVTGAVNQFEKSQFFGVGGATYSLGSGGVLIVDMEGNVFFPVMANGQVINGIVNSSYPDGAWIVVVPQVSGRIGVNNGPGLWTANGGLYWFEGGEPLIFVRRGSVWHLMNRGEEEVTWSNAGIVYAAGMSGTLRYMEDVKGWLSLDGKVVTSGGVLNNTVVATLPVGKRPQSVQRMAAHLYGVGLSPNHNVVPLTINVNGEIVIHDGIGGAFEVFLTNIRYKLV